MSYEPEIEQAIKEAGVVQMIASASPTARELVDAFGEDGLLVDTGDGNEVPGYVLPDGRVRPVGKWRYRVVRDDLPPERNHWRLQMYNEMMKRRRALQIERSEEIHANTDHVLWKDRNGEDRSAPAEFADAAIDKVGVAPMTHPKVWRPHG